MDKNNILEKSRKENRDEGEEYIRDKSMKWTLVTMTVLSAAFAYIRGSHGQSVMDLSVVVCGSVAVSFIYRYVRNRKTESLIFGIVSGCIAVLALVRFCMGY